MKKFIWIISMMVISFDIAAQSGITNSGNLQLHSGSSMTIFGNFTQSSSGSLINAGSLYLKANLTNHLALMDAGTGNLYLNGNVLQNVSGTQPIKTNNLYTNNPAGFNLTNDLRITGTHYYESGILQTSSTNFLVYEAGSSYSGASDDSHVNGLIKKTGSTDFVFPVGNATKQRPISISGISASGEFVARYNSSTTNTDKMQAPIVRINPNEYWTLTATPGITASVTMNWDHSKVPFQNWYVPEITTANYNGSLWVNQGGIATGNVRTTGSITSNTITSFIMFSLGSKAYPLPLSLLDLTAKKQNGFTEVNWKTTNEENISFYQVERSDNAVNFYSLGKLAGRNSGNLENYSYNDTKEIQLRAYYRLRIIEADGKEKYSQIATVTADNLNSQLVLLTNPVLNKIELYASPGMKGIFNYTILSTSGQTISTGKLYIQNSGHYTIPVHLNPGNYLLEMKNELDRFVFKVNVRK